LVLVENSDVEWDWRVMDKIDRKKRYKFDDRRQLVL